MTKQLDEHALVIPSGVEIRAEQDGFVIGNQGDVVIHGQLPIALKQLFSVNGNVLLHSETPLTLVRLDAPRGEVRISGSIDVRSILAQKIFIEGADLTAGSIVADVSIFVNTRNLQADVLMSPQVEIDAHTRGRATVIEARNDLGAHRLKGGFRIEEYLEIFPNGQQMLAQYADVVDRLNEAVDSVEEDFDEDEYEDSADELVETQEESPDLEIEELKSSEEQSESGQEREGEVLTLTDTVQSASETPVVREPDDEVSSHLSTESSDALYQGLSECYLKIIGCYSDLPLPPPLATLENLLEDRRFKDLKQQVGSLWNELLLYHKHEGLHIANAVTNNFKEIKQLLQNRA